MCRFRWNDDRRMMECEPKELQLEFAGLNHLVWVHKAWLNGEDITQTVLEKVGDGANFSMKNIWKNRGIQHF